ncbi:MAG: hypothetical protein RMJ28_00245 [Nitrososphaerota archaeon]|nr:hypothetical protein [Candidatus Calditenuaceae archaeon]MDW8072662.1 hypothetical protein [Nitrososphaerota archaeon]
MRLNEVLGIIATAVFSGLFITSLAARPMLYDYWGENLRRVISGGLEDVGRALSDYVWGGFFPVLTGVIVILLTIVVGLASLLREGE